MFSDASEEGYGVCHTSWEPAATADIGRFSARNRFKRSGGHNARESALSAAGFIRDEVIGLWMGGEIGEAAGWQWFAIQCWNSNCHV